MNQKQIRLLVLAALLLAVVGYLAVSYQTLLKEKVYDSLFSDKPPAKTDKAQADKAESDKANTEDAAKSDRPKGGEKYIPASGNQDKGTSKTRLQYARQAFLKEAINEILVPCKPEIGKIDRPWGIQLLSLREMPHPVFARDYLVEGKTKVPKEDFNEMQAKHDKLVSLLRNLPQPNVYEGKGIVISAGDCYLPGAVNVIIQIREMGSTLPIELVLDKVLDYDELLCQDILPGYNAQCVVMEREIGLKTFENLGVVAWTRKVALLLVSSFEEIVFLDSDTFPVKNVDDLFKLEPYTRYKFLLWPDMWHKATSPLFYDIVRVQAGEPIRRDGWPNDRTTDTYFKRKLNKEIVFHDREGLPSFKGVESGQLVIHKKERFRSLLLLLYYNIYGRDGYYPLIYQGVYGSGDRETYSAALTVMGEPYYLNEWEMVFSGYMKANPEGNVLFRESTMVQADPDQSMKVVRGWRQWLQKRELDTRLNPFQNNEYTDKLLTEFYDQNEDLKRPDAFFLHVHNPKINFVHNFVKKKEADYKGRTISEKPKKLLHYKDWDLRLHAINSWVTCNALGESYWKKMELNQKEFCEMTKKYVKLLKDMTYDKEPIKESF